MSVDAHFRRLLPRIESALDRFLGETDAPARTLVEAMRYSLFAGGKRLRPVLVWLAYESAGGTGDGAAPAACAVEMVHTYSLIHDDLPAMDDDDLRRGKPTCHRVYGDALAVLAGDALLTRAFELLASEVSDPEIARRLVSELGAAAGACGMVAGQVRDLGAEGAAPDRELAREIARLKTAALIRASLRMGAISANAPTYLIEKLGVYGDKVGLAFQVVDDILDRLSTAEELGKTPGKDLRSEKLTLPAILGVEAARAEACRWVAEAKAEVAGLAAAEPLAELADFVLVRRS